MRLWQHIMWYAGPFFGLSQTICLYEFRQSTVSDFDKASKFQPYLQKGKRYTWPSINLSLSSQDEDKTSPACLTLAVWFLQQK